MPVPVPPLTLKASVPQTNVTSYSTDPEDHPILEKLSSLIPRLVQDDLAALGIVALNEGYEPDTVYVDFNICGSSIFNQCIEIIQDLSRPGKVALSRCILELLAVSHITPGIADKPVLPTLPPVPPSHPENAWCLMSIEDAIAFARSGRLDPAILILQFSSQSLQVIPDDLLVAANDNLPGLMEVLKGEQP